MTGIELREGKGKDGVRGGGERVREKVRYKGKEGKEKREKIREGEEKRNESVREKEGKKEKRRWMRIIAEYHFCNLNAYYTDTAWISLFSTLFPKKNQDSNFYDSFSYKQSKMFVRTYPAYSASNVRYVSYPRPGGQRTVADDIRRSTYWSWGIRSLIDTYSPVQCGETVRNGEIDIESSMILIIVTVTLTVNVPVRRNANMSMNVTERATNPFSSARTQRCTVSVPS